MVAFRYLLIIDNSSLDDAFKSYFAYVNLFIVHQFDYLPLPCNAQRPLVILIHSTIVKNNHSLINELYTKYSVPVIIISDEENEELCIDLLEAGADDFIIKPLHAREVHARISTICRRVTHVPQKKVTKHLLLFKQWCLCPASRQIFDTQTQQELKLSIGEYDLLFAFLQQPKRILAREFLLNNTKNGHSNPFDRRIDIQISRLRQKIESDHKKPALIKTIRNKGYLFTASVQVLKKEGHFIK